jgi:outer membrane protein
MQQMNMPVNNAFDIDSVNVDTDKLSLINTNSEDVYNIALDIQPAIESAQLNIKSAETGVKLSKSEGLPSLNLVGGLQTVYGTSLNGVDYGEQLSNGTNPYIGLNLSVPIFQNKKAKTQVKLAEIQLSNTELNFIQEKSNLRKYIEQACIDVQTAQMNYAALQEQLEAEQESYNVASEMFSQGMVNSVDFLLSKNNLIIAENKFTQAKYILVLQSEIVEYYLGKPIEL